MTQITWSICTNWVFGGSCEEGERAKPRGWLLHHKSLFLVLESTQEFAFVDGFGVGREILFIRVYLFHKYPISVAFGTFWNQSDIHVEVIRMDLKGRILALFVSRREKFRLLTLIEYRSYSMYVNFKVRIPQPVVFQVGSPSFFT